MTEIFDKITSKDKENGSDLNHCLMLIIVSNIFHAPSVHIASVAGT